MSKIARTLVPLHVASLAASAVMLVGMTAPVSFAHDRTASSQVHHDRDGRGDARRDHDQDHKGSGGDRQRQHGPADHRGGSGSTVSSQQPAPPGRAAEVGGSSAGTDHATSGSNSSPAGDASSTSSAPGSAGNRAAIPGGPAASTDDTGSGARLITSVPKPASAAQVLAIAPQTRAAALAAPTGEVLGASTTSTAALGAATQSRPVQVSLAAIPGVVAHTYVLAADGAGGVPATLKIALMISSLALNAAGLIYFLRRRGAGAPLARFMPLSLGGQTYRSSGA